MLQRRLTPAEELTAKGARLIAEQRERVAVLERHCAEAKELLAHLEELRAMQIADVERIRRELSACS